MDLVERGNYLPVTILEGSTLLASNLLHRQIQIEGICEFSGEGVEGQICPISRSEFRAVENFHSNGGNRAKFFHEGSADHSSAGAAPQA